MRALVLSGGGAKGAYQLGCLRALIDRGQKWDVVVGTSVGALNALGMAFLGIEEMEKIWFGIKSPKDIIKANNWLSILLLKKRGYYSLEPLKKLLKSKLRYDMEPMMPAYFGVVDLKDTGIRFFPATRIMETNINSVIASSAMPAIMEPYKYDFVDGGVRDPLPLSFAVKQLDAEEITVISATPIDRNIMGPWSPGHIKILGHALRAIDIMSQEILWNDLSVCEMRNRDAKYKKIKLVAYAPEYPLVIDTLDFYPEKIRNAYAEGVDMANWPKMAF